MFTIKRYAIKTCYKCNGHGYIKKNGRTYDCCTCGCSGIIHYISEKVTTSLEADYKSNPDIMSIKEI